MDSPKDTDRNPLEKFLGFLSEDQDVAANMYEDLRIRLSRFFFLRGIVESLEAAEEAIDRVIAKHNQGEVIEDYLRYSYGIARNVLLEKIRQQKIRMTGEAQIRSTPDAGIFLDNEDDSEDEILTRFKACLDGISELNRRLLTQYFSQKGKNRDYRESIANSNGMNVLALRSRIYRIKKDLEMCLKEKK